MAEVLICTDKKETLPQAGERDDYRMLKAGEKDCYKVPSRRKIIPSMTPARQMDFTRIFLSFKKIAP